MTPTESNPKSERYQINRRRLLQMASIGVGSFTMTTMDRGVARAANSCASGPFKRTYTAETVNISKITKRRVDYEKSENLPPVVEEAIEKVEVDRESPSPASGAQHPPTSEGLLTIGTEYDGIRDKIIIEPPVEDPPIVAPSDAQIAVGCSKTVQAINQKIAIFNQRSGTLELEVPFERFFAPLITEEKFFLDRPAIADPRLRYDPKAERFVLSCFYMHFPSWSGSWFLAVTDTSNPNGTWHLYRIPSYSGDWPDYPPLGLDQDAIYLTALTIPESSAFSDFDLELAIIDKRAAYSGEEMSVNHFTGLFQSRGLQLTVQPGFQPFSGGQSGPYYLMSSQTQEQLLNGKQDTGLTLWEVTDPLVNPSVTCSVLEVDPFSAPPAVRQPNTNFQVDPVGDRLMNLDYNNGSLWTAHAIRFNWDDGTNENVAAIRWYEIDPTTPEIIQSGTYGESETSYFLPRIESDGDRTLMGYNVSGKERFPSIEVAGRTAEIAQGEIEASIVIQEGESSFIHPTKFGGRSGGGEEFWWGDYMGISVHPTTGHFWVTGQYSPDFDISRDGEEPDRYQTHIAEVSFSQ